MISELETKIAPIKELDQRQTLGDGVDTREEAIDGAKWTYLEGRGHERRLGPMERAVVRRRGRAGRRACSSCGRPSQKAWATYDVRYDDGRVAEAADVRAPPAAPGPQRSRRTGILTCRRWSTRRI